MDFSPLKFRPHLVLVEPVNQESIGGIRLSQVQRPPFMGYIVALGACDESLDIDDLVIFEINSAGYPLVSTQYLRLLLRTELGIAEVWCDADMEPIIRDACSTSSPLIIRLLDHSGAFYQFLNRQVADFSLVEMSASEIDTRIARSIQIVAFGSPTEIPKEFYIIHEDLLLSVLE